MEGLPGELAGDEAALPGSGGGDAAWPASLDAHLKLVTRGSTLGFRPGAATATAAAASSTCSAQQVEC